MAGRAGRRGKDTEGTVIIMRNRYVSYIMHTYSTMLLPLILIRYGMCYILYTYLCLYCNIHHIYAYVRRTWRWVTRSSPRRLVNWYPHLPACYHILHDTIHYTYLLLTFILHYTISLYTILINYSMQVDGIKSHFKTSYGLAVKLLETRSIEECRALIERGFGAYVLQKRVRRK